MTIVVNQSWSGQRITGQQRYAQEISRRLLEQPDVVGRPRRDRTSRWGAWLGAQALAIPRSPDDRLLTLTSRGPLWHPKHILTIHDHFVLTNPEWFSRRYVATHAPLLRAQVAGAAGLVFVSAATQERHMELFGDGPPSIVAPNGVRPPGQHVGPASHQVEQPFLLAVGSGDPRKNIDNLVRAYSTLPAETRRHCPLVLVGGGDATIFASRGEAGPSEGVRMLDYVTEAELWNLYRRATALVMPSLDEGFGLPLVEAASVGTPLIISDIPVFRWVAGESATYFEPQDVSAISEALSEAIRCPTALPEAPEVLRRFDWKVSSDMILKFVREL